jgi:hypothetical protein
VAKAAALEDPIEEAAAISSCNTFLYLLSGLLIVKIIGRFFRCGSSTAGKSTFVAAGS